VSAEHTHRQDCLGYARRLERGELLGRLGAVGLPLIKHLGHGPNPPLINGTLHVLLDIGIITCGMNDGSMTPCIVDARWAKTSRTRQPAQSLGWFHSVSEKLRNTARAVSLSARNPCTPNSLVAPPP